MITNSDNKLYINITNNASTLSYKKLSNYFDWWLKRINLHYYDNKYLGEDCKRKIFFLSMGILFCIGPKWIRPERLVCFFDKYSNKLSVLRGIKKVMVCWTKKKTFSTRKIYSLYFLTNGIQTLILTCHLEI